MKSYYLNRSFDNYIKSSKPPQTKSPNICINLYSIKLLELHNIIKCKMTFFWLCMMNNVLIDVSTDAFAYQKQRDSDTTYHIVMTLAILLFRIHQYLCCVQCVNVCLMWLLSFNDNISFTVSANSIESAFKPNWEEGHYI